METPEHQDPTWQLLLKARRVKPSPMFSRNILREIRGMSQERSGWAEFWQKFFHRPLPLLGAGAALAALTAALLLVPAFNQPVDQGVAVGNSRPEATISDFSIVEEVHSVEYLGALMAVTDPSQLDDKAFADLLY
ncbi:MAG: hypothetical protein R3F31_27595 [Verrucomicrobiales bacterium]|nr:hypothetical protein [Verrucomicrobiae bacterium]MCP5555643.1 hypothetical protein [Akkermansiaceae bacterium]